jgi:hypothetical protein
MLRDALRRLEERLNFEKNLSGTGNVAPVPDWRGLFRREV